MGIARQVSQDVLSSKRPSSGRK